MRKRTIQKNKTFDLFLILLGIMIIIDSIYSFGIFYSFTEVAKEFGLGESPFIIFTYLFIMFKFLVGIYAIIKGKKERKRL